jgi:hypothetical protein
MATSAMRSLNKFTFYSKEIEIAYAKSKSNIVKIKDGTYYQRTNLKRSNEDEANTDSKRFKEEMEGEDELTQKKKMKLMRYCS